jgi:hypothetical protein
MADKVSYRLKGAVLGGCNCDWGCLCNFEVAPSYGVCEGEYIWCIEQGHYADTKLDGLNFGMFLHSPAAIYLGNLTMAAVVDERASAPQRAAMEKIISGVAPFEVFFSLTSTFLGIRYAAFEVHLEGIHSRVNIPEVFELGLTLMTNPVTGAPELATLTKPTGFTSEVSELCTTVVERLAVEGLPSDHSGKYGEYAPFEYTG